MSILSYSEAVAIAAEERLAPTWEQLVEAMQRLDESLKKGKLVFMTDLEVALTLMDREYAALRKIAENPDILNSLCREATTQVEALESAFRTCLRIKSDQAEAAARRKKLEERAQGE